MSQILVLSVDLDEAGSVVGVRANLSDGLTEPQALLAVQVMEREMQRRAIRAELEAERATQPEGEQADGPA